jgi:HAD superfamily hydrolase (TIGR01484 family)
MFSDILMTVDFDRTLTAIDGSIPQRNIEAIRYFMENGGSFTVNTGRSYVSFQRFLDIVPCNAPLILMNGSAGYENGQFVDVQYLPVEVWPTAQKVAQQFPGVNMEFQNPDMHYLVSPSENYAAYYRESGFPHELADPAIHPGPFVKIGVYGDLSGKTVVNEQEEKPLFDRVEEFLNREFGDKLVVFRATPRIINVHAKGASKLMAAKKLQQKLGKKILVCVGDEGNDIPMLRGADFAFCPSDGAIAADFPNVCPCSEGAVADVIYRKLPEILKG